MSMNVRECSMVSPASETPRQNLRLSRLDMMICMPYSHNRYIYIYHPKVGTESSPKVMDTAVLKGALSKALVSFYPLAGRLRKKEESNEIEIECNAQGVLFVEAETPHLLSDLGDGVDLIKIDSELRKKVVPTWDYSKGLSSIPLLMVQFTRFKCGGVCLGVARHHHICDGTAYTYFIQSWSRIARGLQLSTLPVHDRSCIQQLTPRRPPKSTSTTWSMTHLCHPYHQPTPEGVHVCNKAATMERFFTLSRSQIDALKLEAASSADEEGYKLSTYEVVAGHIWRCVSKVRRLPNEQHVKLYIPVDARSRFKNPTPPKGYFGNLIFFAACIAKVEDITCKPLCYAASKIHEALQRMKDEEYLKSAIDYLESKDEPLVVIKGGDSVTCPNLLINSWVRIPFYEADFGSGKPKFFGNGGVRREGLCFLVPTPNGDDGFSLMINLYKVHMALFEKCLYDFQVVSS
ncbi:Anthranilate N-benzoyltransferase protein 2 [Bienertia sinuspersici]